MTRDGWNLVTVYEDGQYYRYTPNCNPKKSGRYLCSCVNYYMGEEVSRYMTFMEYDAKKEHWHDPHRPNAVSHNVLAWRDDIKVCDFTRFEYITGGLFKKK